MLDHDIDRRAALGRLAALLGVATLPTSALAAPGHASRRYLTPAQFRLMEAVADTILPTTDTPGALAARVPARLDGMLRDWASASTREAIQGALRRIDAAALAARGQSFTALPATDRTAVLLPHDAAALVPAKATQPATMSGLRMGKAVTDQGYFVLKQLVIDLFYFSPEANATELVYEHVPGKFEPSLRLTAGSRPFLNLY